MIWEGEGGGDGCEGGCAAALVCARVWVMIVLFSWYMWRRDLLGGGRKMKWNGAGGFWGAWKEVGIIPLAWRWEFQVACVGLGFGFGRRGRDLLLIVPLKEIFAQASFLGDQIDISISFSVAVRRWGGGMG